MITSKIAIKKPSPIASYVLQRVTAPRTTKNVYIIPLATYCLCNYLTIMLYPILFVVNTFIFIQVENYQQCFAFAKTHDIYIYYSFLLLSILLYSYLGYRVVYQPVTNWYTKTFFCLSWHRKLIAWDLVAQISIYAY